MTKREAINKLKNEYDEKDLYASVNSFSDTEREVVVSLKKKKIAIILK